MKETKNNSTEYFALLFGLFLLLKKGIYKKGIWWQIEGAYKYDQENK